MRHPFDGLNGVGRVPATSSQDPAVSRRSVLGKMVFATAGALGACAVARAQNNVIEVKGAQPTTLAIGEEGGNGSGSMEAPAAATTEPFGEEAGNVTSRMVPGLEDGGAPGKATEAKNEDGGGATTEALGEEGGPVTGARREGGGPVTKALNEGGGQQPAVQVITVKPLTLEIKDKDLDTIWGEMGNDTASKSLQACAELYGAKKGLGYLKDHLNLKVTEPDQTEVNKLLAKLDDNEFSAREEAEAQLVKLGPSIQPTIEKAAKDHKSAEMQMRLNRILAKFKENNPLHQAEKGLEVLVALRTPEAKDLLKELAKGDDKDWLVQKAKKALERAK